MNDWEHHPCIDWPGSTNPDGYGIWRGKLNGKPKQQLRAHRMVYEAVFGPIPEGLVIDHLCRNRSCTQPWHLEPVTRGENVRRGIGAEVQRARHAARTHCKRGHSLTGDTHKVVKDGKGVPYRACNICRRDIYRRYKARRKTNVG